MKTKVFVSVLFCLCSLAINAQTYDNHQKEYVLTSQTDGSVEASRTHRMVLCDYQPSGLYVKRGERFTVTVADLKPGYDLQTMIGFKPMWGNRNKTQEDALRNGVNTITASQDGILSFIFVKSERYDARPSTVQVSVRGGRAFPLYQLNWTDPERWQSDLRTMKDAPFVQLISDKALLTITYKDYLKTPIQDIGLTFSNIHKVIDWEDELAGFDNSSPENMRTRNRLHYLIDLYSTPEEAENYYMYASNYLIGMKRDNFTDLTEKLDREWGIWHETGHTHQQQSWTWDSISEISVNMFSLYVQEKFGLPTRLGTSEEGDGPTTFEKAREYIARPEKNYLSRNEEDYNELFTKLVMFHQLKSIYGWDIIKKLHQYFRKQPYVEKPDESDADMAQRFVYAMCVVSRNNLVPFFNRWGIRIDAATTRKIKSLGLPPPAVDPSKVFE
jgi:hypothetical protein